ncbi:MAG: molybdopterin-dependent oxidoreductase [Peptococcaceae bacterium]|jgi:anaerobic selenocysteine-containing dehydrogenase|nr:molybdopterin-dependent oxidoreductase [Peptococcaceae bacterium]
MPEEVFETVCGVCHFGCPVRVTVRDGEVARVEPSRLGSGYLCAKGLAGRAYLYREDRVKTPLRRLGKRGEGRFEPVTWAEAYREIAAKILEVKAMYGADGVAFFTGYSKWYRPLLHRLAHSFGTLNYGTESSSCHTASVMANLVSGGVYVRPDTENAELLLSWGENPFYSTNYAGDRIGRLKEKGLLVISVDPRLTPWAKRYADIHLRPRPGTDGALAHCFANRLIEAGAVDKEFIEKYVHGYRRYAEYARGFTPERAAGVTGIPAAEIERAARLLTEHSGSLAVGISQAGLTHHVNGFQNYRAAAALAAITGNYDREGGVIPVEYSGRLADRNFPRLRVDEFIAETRPDKARPKIGSERFPLWAELVDEFQAMDLPRQVLTAAPYPLRALVGFGVNARMFPGDGKFFAALEALDFFLDTEIFMTDTARYADIILPACTSYERSELVGVMGGPIRYSSPVIAPLYDSRSDADIICQLAAALEVEDAVLRAGYDACARQLLSKVGLTLEDLRLDSSPRRVPGKEPYIVGSTLRNGFATPTGKYELYSETVAQYAGSHGLDPLPTYVEPPESPDGEYPLTLTVGGRLPNAFHSRFHQVVWARSLRPNPALDINPADAGERGIEQDDAIAVATPWGEITVRANVTLLAPAGGVFFYQGYSEADGNGILDADGLDPYSGFPAFRSAKCQVRKVGQVREVERARKRERVRRAERSKEAAPVREAVPVGKAAPAREAAPVGKAERSKEAASGREAVPVGKGEVAV